MDFDPRITTSASGPLVPTVPAQMGHRRSEQSRPPLPVGNIRTPHTLDTAAIRFPIVTPELENRLRDILPRLPSYCGYDDPGFQKNWEVYLEVRLWPPLRDNAAFIFGTMELDQLKAQHLDAQRQVSVALQEAGGLVPAHLEDLTGETVDQSIQDLVEANEKAYTQWQAATKGENRAALLIKALLGIPMLAIFTQVTGLGWTTFTVLATVLLSLAVCMTYLLAFRGMFQAWASPANSPEDNTRSIFPKEPFTRHGKVGLLLLYALLFLACTGGWIVLDTVFITRATSADSFGDAAEGLPFYQALAIASVFTCLLALSSLAYLHLDFYRRRARAFSREFEVDLRKGLSALRGQMEKLEAQVRAKESTFTPEREAEHHSSAQAAWWDLLSLLSMLQSRAPAEEIVDHMRGPASPEQVGEGECCGVCVEAEPVRPGVFSRIRDRVKARRKKAGPEIVKE